MKFLSWILVLFFLMGISCTEKEKHIRKKDIIPDNELIDLLTDIHIGDGILDMPSYLKKYPGKDSISNYSDVIHDLGFTRERFDLTLKYYANNPDDFELVYEKVLNKLSQLESEIRSQRSGIIDDQESSNLWMEIEEFHLPRDGKRNKIPFNIAIQKQGFYIIRARIKMYKDDASVNPRLTAWFWYEDGTGNGVRYFFPENKVKKDETWRYYTISLKTNSPKITHIKGFILNHDNTGTEWEKHADIENISIQLQTLDKK